MTRVDFYVLEDLTADAALRFACRLCAKGFQTGTPVHVHAASDDQAKTLDELMWDYPRHRFLPHDLLGPNVVPAAPIHIGAGEPVFSEGLLVNLHSEVPDFFGRFDRLAEIIVGETRDAGRARYKHYRDRGYQLHHHDMGNWEQND